MSKSAGSLCPKCASQCAEYQTLQDRYDGRMRWSCNCGAGGEFAVPKVVPPKVAAKPMTAQERRWVRG